MFITQSQPRNRQRSVGVSERTLVSDRGLGLTVTTTTRFDPRRMAQREQYWFQQIVDDLASQYREAGYVDGLSGLSGLGINIPGVSFVTPIIAKIPIIGGFFSSIFGGKPKAPHIPWGEIYAQARPIAQQYARQEEEARIAQEGVRIQQEQVQEIQKVSERAATFQLPEGVTAIKGGALVIQPKGSPVEVRKK